MTKKHPIGIICAVNDDIANLDASLESILKQSAFRSLNVYLNVSTDCQKSLKIAQKYTKKYPETFSLETSKEDCSIAEMLIGTLGNCNNPYVVLLPAGDVFCDKNYISSQISLLSKNSSANGVFCLAKDKSDDSIIPFDYYSLKTTIPSDIGTNYFSKYSLVAYSAIMFRNRHVTFPKWFKNCEDPYFALIYLNLGRAKLLLNDNVMVEKYTGFNLLPFERYSKNRAKMLHELYKYCMTNLNRYTSKTLRISIINEINFALTQIAGERDVKVVFNEMCESSEEQFAWIKKYIKKYNIILEDIQLTGNLHKEYMKLRGLPMVTVICITYKHEDFIRQALDSFLMQKTNFKYQIFVGEDKGPDNTANIIREYAEKYPEKIVPFIREKNMGAQRNLIDMCQKAQTPYIAFCEGDDYWCDEYKLQKQFDYMENHHDLRSCFHDAEIKDELDVGWFLSEQFQNEEYEKNGNKMIWPRTMNGFVPKKTYRAGTYIKCGFVHTSSMFFRWDYNIEIPEWYYTHLLGDFTIWLIQLGTGKFGYIPQIMSVYRRHEGGAYYFNDNFEYMLKTRSDWIALLRNLKQYFIDNHLSYKVDVINRRLSIEINNLLYTITCCKDYPHFLSTIQSLGSDVYDVIRWIFNNQYIQKTIQQNTPKNLYWYFETFPNAQEKLDKKIDRIKQRYEKQQEIKIIKNYWIYSLVPKKKNTWVFSGFWGKSYMDNTMYLFEYINKHNPEINAVWVSKDEEVVEKITKLGYTAYLEGTSNAVKALKTAYVGFVDHYTMSDFGEFKGYNKRLKIVQLWHGVGIKKMADVVKLSTVKGSQLSSDILINKNDSILRKIKKIILSIPNMPNRELFEKYLMYVCPGQEMIEDCHAALTIPRETFFLCGYPRTAQLSTDLPMPKSKKILYAPTYRWSHHLEQNMVNDLVDKFPVIQKAMEEIDGEFVIRFHPHTWRDYDYKIKSAIYNYNRIKIDTAEDIYKNMSDYFCMVSDYSSIVYDFLLLNRPLVFHCPDLKYYMSADNDLKYDYTSASPGSLTNTWDEAMNAIIEYSKNPQKDSEQRLKVRDFFYDMSANNAENSKRIVEEVKKRIDL
ncbi:MAG: glycosyltransferase [Ruminococcaceae bacterium]|nr:glycosyltransferase [Oscillospiraceae bacterium]